jgi:hypothetical protein
MRILNGRIKRLVYWEEMKTDIKNSIIAYEFCQRNKSDNLSLVGLLLKYGQMLLWILLEDYPKPWERTQSWWLVDRLTKYVHFIPLRHPYTVTDVAAVFLQEIVRLHGFPSSIFSDRDPLFLNNFLESPF